MKGSCARRQLGRFGLYIFLFFLVLSFSGVSSPVNVFSITPTTVTRSPDWKSSFSWPTHSLDVSGNGQGQTIVIGTGGSGLTRLDQNDGKPLWSDFDGYTVYASVSGNGQLIVAVRELFNSNRWHFYVLDLQGNILKDTDTGLNITPNEGFFLSVSYTGNTIVANTFNELLVFDSSGNLLWQKATTCQMTPSSVSSDGSTLTVGCTDSTISRFARGGTLLWSVSAGNSILSLDQSPTGGLVAAKTSDGGIRAYNGNGQLLWSTLKNAGGMQSWDQFQKWIDVSHDGTRIYTSVLNCNNSTHTCWAYYYSYSNIGTQLWVTSQLAHVWPSWIASSNTQVVFGSTSEDIWNASVPCPCPGHIGHVHLLDTLGNILWSYDTSSEQFNRVAISDDSSAVLAGGWNNQADGWIIPFAVTIYTTPASFFGSTVTGTVSACGETLSNSQASSSCGSSFTATANMPSPSVGWGFDHWSWSGGMTCNSNVANPTSCSATGPSILVATYSVQVTFGSGLISWNSCSSPPESNGASIMTAAGSVTACYVPVGYSPAGWICSGGLACSGSNDVTEVTATGPGSITLNLKTGSLSNPVSTSLTASASPNSLHAGSSFTVSGSLTAGGAGLGGKQILLVFGWNSNIVAVTTQSDGSYTYVVTPPVSAGSYDVEVLFLGDFSGSTQYLPSTAIVRVTVT